VIGCAAPGTTIIALAELPLGYGYIEFMKTNRQFSSLLMFPGIIGTAYGFQYAYTRQLYAMASSGLLPKVLTATFGPNQTAHVACLVGSFLSLALLLVCYHLVDNFAGRLFAITMFGSCCVYIALFRSFMICCDRYSNMERSFTSPLGKAGAVYGILVFFLVLIGLAFFQKDNYEGLASFVVFLIVGMGYYVFVAKKREFFSAEEQDKFMKAYILNANNKKKKFKKSRSRNQSASANALLTGLNKVLPASMQLGLNSNLMPIRNASSSTNSKAKSASQASVSNLGGGSS
jgi:ethanolamine permease